MNATPSEVSRLVNEVVASGIPLLEARAEVQFAIANDLVDDVRFEISPFDEDGEALVRSFRLLTNEQVDHFWTRDPYGYVDSYRTAQAERLEYPDLEDRLNYYAEIGL